MTEGNGTAQERMRYAVRLSDRPLLVGWWAAYGALAIGSASLLARRLAGSFERSPSVAALVAVGCFLVICGAVLRGAAVACGVRWRMPRQEWMWLGGLSLVSLLLMLAISMPGSPGVGLVVAWSCVAAAESSWWTRRWPRSSPEFRSSSVTASDSPNGSATDDVSRPQPRAAAPFGLSAVRTATSVECATPQTVADTGTGPGRDANPGRPLAAERPLPSTSVGTREDVAGSASDREHTALPPDITQQITRGRSGEGAEVVWGSLRVHFAPGERTKAVHVSFCPPLDKVPSVCAEPSAGPDANVDVVQAAPYGARLEVNLQQLPTTQQDLVLEFEAIT